MSQLEFMERMEWMSRIYRWELSSVGYLPNADGVFNMVHLISVFVLAVYLLFAVVSWMMAGWPDDLDQVAYYSTPFLAQLLLTSKFFIYIIRRKDNYQLMLNMNKFWRENSENPVAEQALLEEYARYAYLFNLVQTATMFIAGPLWLVTPLIKMYLLAYSPTEVYHRILPLEHWVPFHIDMYADPFYEIIYAVQILALFLSMNIITGTDCYFVHIVINICGQFKLLQLRITNFDKDSNGTEISMEEQEKNIHSCIDFHQRLLEYCEQLEGTMTITMVIQILGSVTFLCTPGFIITMFPSNTFIKAQSVLCLMSGLWEIFMVCYTANLLTTEGLEVAFAVYDSNWFAAPQDTKKLLLFIMMRAQRPIYLTVGKFTPLSVATFETVTRTAASYFTVLTSMQKEN